MVFFAILSAVFNVPVLCGLLSIVFFASIGISLGVRRAYIKVLLKIFEVCLCVEKEKKTNDREKCFIYFTLNKCSKNTVITIITIKLNEYVCVAWNENSFLLCIVCDFMREWERIKKKREKTFGKHAIFARKRSQLLAHEIDN